MPPPPILDLARLDCENIVFTRQQIYSMLPQQYEMSQLDAIIYEDREAAIFAAYRDVRVDEWWCRGHMPGSPIFPGVLMMEAAAQLSAFAQKRVCEDQSFIMGFAGVDEVKFRDSVIPPTRIILVGQALDKRERRFKCVIQSFVKGNMAFEGIISGMRLKL